MKLSYLGNLKYLSNKELEGLINNPNISGLDKINTILELRSRTDWEPIEKEKIKILAQRSLDEKWYPLRDDENFNYIDWISRCPFCDDCKNSCSICLIGFNSKNEFLICGIIDSAHEEDDIEIIIGALEELVKLGKLSDDTKRQIKIRGG